MVKYKKGFTIVEVSLFLAITSLLFFGVAAGVQSAIFQQRYNDAVQSFVEFLRGVYGGVSNVQSLNTGKTEKAIYGKLVTFGENYDTDGNKIEGLDERPVFVYDVIGNVEGASDASAIKSLIDVDANIVVKDNGTLKPVGVIDSFTPKWFSRIQFAETNFGEYKQYDGALLIVRHPRSGNVYTFVKDNGTIQVNEWISNNKGNPDTSENILKTQLEAGSFVQKNTDYCINMFEDQKNVKRTDVRIVANSRNTSGIDVISGDVQYKDDGSGNNCNE